MRIAFNVYFSDSLTKDNYEIFITNINGENPEIFENIKVNDEQNYISIF